MIKETSKKISDQIEIFLQEQRTKDHIENFIDNCMVDYDKADDEVEQMTALNNWHFDFRELIGDSWLLHSRDAEFVKNMEIGFDSESVATHFFYTSVEQMQDTMRIEVWTTEDDKHIIGLSIVTD